MRNDTANPASANRLARETSPYLLQHAHNPVDWYPWGPEALERARTENRPILLSIGYSACHWCHVMAHESFEDAQTARLMNEHFVNIKVDREERPDIDSIYMAAVQQMTGHGGWPLTAFLTPEGLPFYGGTYYPPAPRHGMPSFSQVLLGVAEAYRERGAQVAESAAEMHGLLRQHFALRARPAALNPSLPEQAVAALIARFDPRDGGLGGAPKFPQPLVLEFLLRVADGGRGSGVGGRETAEWQLQGEGKGYGKGEAPGTEHQQQGAERRHQTPGTGHRALQVVETTLRKMAAGGIYDQIGGGFHRYSVDAKWLVPHFEKMLYDNALLARLYLHAWQATGDALYRRVAEETLHYVRREMVSPEGGFFSAQDADSEGEEGRFYVWTPEQVDALLGPEDGALFRRYYDVTEGGNWVGDPHVPGGPPTSILHADRSAAVVAAEVGVPVDQLERVLARGRDALYQARSERVWPGLDDKVLTSWNAMMLRTFAEAAHVLGRPEYREIAVRNAEFLTHALWRNGQLLRTYKDGTAKVDGFLEDYALLADALVAVYVATADARWVRIARDLAEGLLERFWDEEQGVFYDTAGAGEALIVRPRDVFDNPTPSGSSAAVVLLQRLAVLLGEERYARVAARVLESMGELVTRMPSAFGELLGAVDFHLAPPKETAVVGARGAADTEALLDVFRTGFYANVVLAVKEPGDEAADQLIPLLRDRAPVDGRAAAYVCERFACRRPVTDAAALRAELGGS